MIDVDLVELSIYDIAGGYTVLFMDAAVKAADI